jgi:uncharacterized membrane protein
LSNKNNNRKLQNNSRNSIPRSARSGSRDLLLATIGVLGCLLSLGLLWSNLWQESLPYCSAQSGCNLVQSSKWSHFLGMPLTFFGALLYMGIAFSALRIIDKKKTVNLATIFSTTGFLISAYLMVIAQYVIEVFCFYCFISFLLITLAFLKASFFSGKERKRHAHLIGLTFATLIISVMHASHSSNNAFSSKESLRLRSVAEHLSARGFKFYGASWCAHCQEQKELFGSAANSLPYVECSKYGPKGPRVTECELMKIQNYPTWIIENRRIERIISVERLIHLSGFTEENP